MDLRREVHEEMLLLRKRTAELTAALVCTVDGMLVTADVREGAEQAAALSSALLSLSGRVTDLARAGLDLKEIALFAGHRSTGSTMAYIHLSGRDLARAFDRASQALANRLGQL